jgi:Tol biopolymer transport system component/uncharacterized membrane protein YbhN (UPF0104 family)
MKKRRLVFLVFSLSVSVGIFYYLFSYINFSDVLDLLQGVDSIALFAFVASSFAMSIFRSWRYLLLLSISGFAPGKVATFLVVLVRNFFSDLLPARLGSLIYVFILTTRLGVNIGASGASFSLAFLFDILALAPLVLVAILFLGAGAVIPVEILILLSVVLIAISATLIHFLPWFCLKTEAILAVPFFKQFAISKTMSNAFEGIKVELEAIRAAGIYTKVVVLSLAVRGFKYLSLYLFLYALLKPLGFTFQEMPFAKVFLGMCSAELVASLPISGIGAFGVYEGTWAVTFKMLGFSSEISKLTAVSHHLFTQLYGYILGLVALVLLMTPIFKNDCCSRDIKMAKIIVKPFWLKFVTTVTVCFLLIFSLLNAPEATSEQKQSNEHSAQPQFVPSNQFKGKVVYDSNRAGTFGIYQINLTTGEIEVLFDTEQHEMFPDPSPNGKLIVFAKTNSLVRFAPSQIWLYDARIKQAIMLTENGTFPTFSADGGTIYFERERRKVMAVDIDGGNLREIYPKEDPTFARYQVVKPRISMSEKLLTFTSDKGGRWHAWAVKLSQQESFLIGKGCEPVPSDQKKKIIWIENEHAKGGSGIMSYDTASGVNEVLFDRGEGLSQEYFPSLSSDGRHLLYSASASDQHSHESGNYQLFILELSTGNITQLTSDSFTNRWPKWMQSSTNFTQ